MGLPRYLAYKDSGVEWIGSVPMDWEVVPLKRLLDLQNGADHKAIETDDGVPVIGSGGAFAFASMAMFDGESVLLGRKGTIDRPIYVNGPFWTVDTMYWSKVNSGVSAKFAYYAATTIPFGYYSTNTALPSMTKAALNAHAVACPAYDEQSAIATFLDRETAKIDALIAEQERLLELLAEKRQAVISHAVTKGLNPDAPMKDSGVAWLGEVPAHWEVVRVGHILEAIGDVDHFMPASIDKGFPYLMTGDLEELLSHVALEDCKQVSEEDYLKLSRKIKAARGDVVMARYATIGTLMYVDIDAEFLVSYSCVTLKPNRKKVAGRYLFFCMKSDAFKQGVEHKINTNTQGNVGIEDIKSLKLAMPSIEEQMQISAFLESESGRFEALEIEAELGISLLRERRSALIAAAITGQIDVREAA